MSGLMSGLVSIFGNVGFDFAFHVELNVWFRASIMSGLITVGFSVGFIVAVYGVHCWV